MNTLYCGDNLLWLRSLPSNHVDLIYLDPPFKSGRNYNMIFDKEAKKKSGATAQIKAFGDTWSWGDEAKKEYGGLINGTLTKEPPRPECLVFTKAMMEYLGECSLMAYLCMMAPRLVEMRRVLKDTGSIYLHCDPPTSHYLKLLMDSVFGPKNFRNEIVWTYERGGYPSSKFKLSYQNLFFYSKTKDYIFNPIKSEKPMSQYCLDVRQRGWEREGKSALTIHDEEKFKAEFGEKGEGVGERFGKDISEFRIKRGTEPYTYLRDCWIDVPYFSPIAKENTGYPTQKPEKLLERIIKASSNEGDIVLDPFSGTGTTIVVAQRLKRRWIGIDVTLLAIEVIVKRLAEREEIEIGKDFKFYVWPADEYSEVSLKAKDPEGYKRWAEVIAVKPQIGLGFKPTYDRNEVLKKLGVKIKEK